jgi:hypothetical protein
MSKNEQEVDFLRWLAGFWDGEGTFSIVLRKQRTANNYLGISPCAIIGQRGDHDWIIKHIKSELSFGKIYYSNRDTVKGKAIWQTTTIDDSIKIAKLLEPYLILKKEIAKRFIEALELWKSTVHKEEFRLRGRGGRIRTKQDVLKMIEIATTLNKDRPEKRYRNYKKYEDWKDLINEWYE